MPRTHGPGSGSSRTGEASLVRASLRVSLISITWTGLASSASVMVGVLESSSVLIALGLIGLVDLLGSVALASHFRHAVRHERFSVRRENLAHRAVSLGLVVVGLASTVLASVRLLTGQGSHPTVASVMLAATSLVVLAALSWRKRVLGGQLRSRALLGDGQLSGIGAAQALLALMGIELTQAFGAGWADASAALVVGLLAVVVGVSTWQAEHHGA